MSSSWLAVQCKPSADELAVGAPRWVGSPEAPKATYPRLQPKMVKNGAMLTPLFVKTGPAEIQWIPLHRPVGAAPTLGSGVATGVGLALGVGVGDGVAIAAVHVGKLGEPESAGGAIVEGEATAVVQPARSPAAISPTTKPRSLFGRRGCRSDAWDFMLTPVRP